MSAGLTLSMLTSISNSFNLDEAERDFCFCVLCTCVHEYEYILGQGDAQQNIPV